MLIDHPCGSDLPRPQLFITGAEAPQGTQREWSDLAPHVTQDHVLPIQNIFPQRLWADKLVLGGKQPSPDYPEKV